MFQFWFLSHCGASRPQVSAASTPIAHQCEADESARQPRRDDTDPLTKQWAVERRYNAAVIFKRARGQGRIRRYEGLEAILTEFGSHIVDIDLNPIGAPRKDWKKVLPTPARISRLRPRACSLRGTGPRIAAMRPEVEVRRPTFPRS